VTFDTSTVNGAHSILVVATKSGAALSDEATILAPDSKILDARLEIPANKGTCVLPDSVMKRSGVHQVAAIALDGTGKPIAFLSEARSLLVEEAQKKKGAAE
jgi:hypothetical protein